MRSVSLSHLHLSRYELRHTPVGTSRGVHQGRPAFLLGLELVVDGAHWETWSEASPLPAFGHAADDPDLAERELLSVEEGTISEWLALPPLLALERVFRHGDHFRSGAARHALEWLMVEALAHVARTGPAELVLTWLRQRAPHLVWFGPRQVLRASGVLDLLDPALESCAQRLAARRISTWKLKCGRDAEQEHEALRRLVRLGIPARVRLDPGTTWTLEQAAAFVVGLQELCASGPLELEFVEDPTPEPEEWGSLAELCPLAADEVLTRPGAGAAKHAAFWVIKPMVHGIGPSLELATRAHARGRLLIASHAFDGPLALRTSCELGAVLQMHEHAAGLGPHQALGAWDEARIASGRLLRGRRLGPPRLGGGILLDGPHLARALCAVPAADTPIVPASPDLSLASAGDALSARRAGALFGNRPFLSGSVQLTFRGAAERVAQASPLPRAPLPLLAEPTEAAILSLLIALAQHVPVLLLHPAASALARERLVARCLEAGDELAEGDAVIVPTSGSTGDPHLVVHTRASLLASLSASAARLGAPTPATRWLLSLPFAHVGGLSILLRCLAAGANVVVHRLPTSPSEVAELLARERVTHLSLVPTQLGRWLNDPAFSFPSSVECVLVGGAPSSPALRRLAAERRVPACFTYGLTEMASQVATQPPGAQVTSPTLALPPLPSVELAFDERGRVFVGGPMLMRRYLGEPSPLEGGLFRTGDGGTRDALGQLGISGRLDDVIITGGENVSPAEVEAALLGVPGTAEVCVVGRPSDEWGQEVIAVVVAREDAQDLARLEDALVAAARGSLPSYARPKAIQFVHALPTLESGKVDRRRVAADFELKTE